MLYVFFFNDTATTEIYTLSLHDALPIFIEETGSTIDITDDGKVSIFSKDLEVLDHTLHLVNNYVKDVELNEVYEGKVVGIQKFGAFMRSEEHTSELQSRQYLVCRLLLEKKTT